MIKYLIDRPISVFVTFGIFVLLGVLAYVKLPTSLLPDIPVPEITVQVSASDISARELENTAVTSLRQQLMQVSHLRTIQSKTQDESARIHLQFDYGTRMDLAFVEANEKVDAAMNSLPKNMARPSVVKVNATDLPVFDLILTLNEIPNGKSEEEAFAQLCDLAQNVIKRRMEQLPEVAMVDMTGLWTRQLVIRPNLPLMETLGITEKDIEHTFAVNNIEAGSATVRHGNYEYNIRFTNVLRTVEDVANIYIKHGTRVLQLHELAEVSFAPATQKGESFYNGKRALVLSVIKQANSRMGDLQDNVNLTLTTFRQQYPLIAFNLAHDQSNLLEVTLGSLKQNLALGLLLILIITIYFLRDVRLPIIIGTSLLVALIISMGTLHLFRISLNVISLAGLILSVGMMIDNAIIVTDDITQYRQAGLSLDEACVKGVQEVITPMLSSTLTTIAVFLPLVFMSGIAGAIFYDQAVSITLSLLVSYITAIAFLPVLYKLFFRPRKGKDKVKSEGNQWLFRLYDKGFAFVFRHPKKVCIASLLFIPLCILFSSLLRTEKMPSVRHDEITVRIDWNENIHLDENTKRTNALVADLGEVATQSTVLTGQQQFLIGRNKELGSTEAKLYLKASRPDSVTHLQERVAHHMATHHPRAIVTFSPPETMFDEIFTTADPELMIELYPHTGRWGFTADSLRQLYESVTAGLDETIIMPAYSSQLKVQLNYKRLMHYDVSPNEVISTLKSCFGENQFATLRNFAHYVPVQLARTAHTVEDVLATTKVTANNRARYPLSYFVTVWEDTERKHVVAGGSGEYVPFGIQHLQNDKEVESRVRDVMKQHTEWNYSLAGTLFENREMMKSLMFILLISLVMMYLIMTAQFESFLQPLILLIEIPIDIAVGLAFLWMFGQTLNLMSAIGIIVACGIVVNDSILKLNVMNELRQKGMPIVEAIHEAGRRRLRAIVMTSLTSVMAFIPILFSDDLGSELQSPLAIAMIGAMLMGTLVSLFVVPVLYWFIYKKHRL